VCFGRRGRIRALDDMSRRIVQVLAAAACVIAPAVLQAQDTIEPDRPDVTNGTHIVDIGLLQIEVGAVYLRAGRSQHGFASPITGRVGLTDWLEARIGTDGLIVQSDGEYRQTGIGNTNIGAKLRLWADPGGMPLISVLPTIDLPTGDPAKGLGSGDADYLLAVLTGSDLGRHWHADVNYGVGRIGAGQNQPHFTQHLASVSVSAAASDNWNPYVETYWFSKQGAYGGAVIAVDGGAIYELGARYAVDGGVQVNLTGSPKEVAAFGGISMIVGDILGNHGVHARQRQVQRRHPR
jgi:outer membrane putative beta-barrel porin/alpha-amylase